MRKKKCGIKKYRVHRRILSLFLFTLLLSAVSCAAADNLLQNGSFEELDDRGMPVGWYTDAYVLDEGYTVFSVSESEMEDGGHAAAIRNIGENDARFAQKVQVDPESLYRFSGYIRTEGVEDGRGANLSVEGVYSFSDSVYEDSDGWQYIEWYGETGEDQTSVTLFARLGGYSGESTGKAWFDDLRLEKVNSVPGEKIAALWYQASTLSYFDEEESLFDSSVDSPAWPRLIVISLFYSLFAVLVFQWLSRERETPSLQKKSLKAVLFAGLGAALLLRMAVSWVSPGYMVDVNCFTSWGNTMLASGPVNFYPATSFCDYPPAYTYILGLNAWICKMIPGISEAGTRVVYRFFPSLCDILSCLVLYHFLARNAPEVTEKQRVFGLLVLAFHPVTVINSAAWGQIDSVLTLLILLVAIWAIEGKWELCLPCYMLSVLVKPQSLMLGFLGLTAVIFAWIREKESRTGILKGIAAAIAVMLAILIPFSIRQEPFWIIGQYAGTLASYPYATVNTANFYYLLNGNWSAIERTAAAAAPVILALLTACYGSVLYFRARRIWNKIWIETVLTGSFTVFFVICAFVGSSWGIVGTGVMVFAFVIVLDYYIRRGDISFLPFLGGLLFLILYVFGVKMHERYVFPAFLLFALAYCLRRDRRILFVMLTLTCTVFINEGIVLDNSVRLGSAMGHLNQDTHTLAMILAAVNCAVTIYAVNLGLSFALSAEEETKCRRFLSDPVRDNRLHWSKKDTAAVCVIMAVYSLIAFSTLGSRKAPQTAWTSSEYTENIVIDLGETHESFSMLYFARVSRYDFSVSASEDGINWENETWAQMDQGQCWKWKYVTDSAELADGTRNYGTARHWFTGRYVRITAHQINLALCEVLFRDDAGNILPIRSVERFEGDPESGLYSDPGAVADEQNTFEGLPVYFPVHEEGEADPSIPQPSWWNSTYFDEIYHARTAWEFLNSSVPYETSHPPLGKVLMSLGVSVFGMTPFGWRFAGALAGVIMLAVIYLIAKQMTKSTMLSVFTSGLLALDCMHLTQTQIATIDSFPVLFIMLSFFFMLRFLQTDWRTEKHARVLADLGLSGFSIGLAIASKWIGLYAGAGLAVLYFWHGIRVLRRDRRERENTAGSRDQTDDRSENGSALRKFCVLCFWCVLFFIAVPAAIYLISYIPYFSYRHFTSFGEYLQALISSQQGMYNYHSTPGLGMDHPFYSPWYEWPVIGKPMFYATKQYIFTDRLSFSIFCFGNPVIWWSGIPAVVCCAWLWVRNRWEIILAPDPVDSGWAGLDTNLVFLLVGILAQYLPWTLVPRGTYIYHYFASVPFLILALTVCAEQLYGRAPRAGRTAVVCFMALALASFAVFFPYASGILAPVSWLDIGQKFLHIWY